MLQRPCPPRERDWNNFGPVSGVSVRTGGRLASLASLALAAATSVMACAATPAARMAERGDHAALRDAIVVREKAGDLTNGEAASLARLVAEHELRSAPPAEAAERVREVRACAHELDAALDARMGTHDEAGAVAALARLDAGGLGLDDVRDLVADGDPRWRAVGTRSLVRAGDREARLRALLDPSPFVRRAAARAARKAADPRDVAPLAEAARVDPEPIVRTESVRALGALPAAAAADVALALRDLWTTGDDGLREDIALAWAATPVWRAGGRDALRVLLATGHGPGVVDGAVAVLHRADADAEVAQLALGAVARAIEGGPRQTRLQALALAPLDAAHRPLLLPLVEKAAGDDDLEVRVSALSRQAEAGAPGAPGAVQQLEGLAQPGSPVSGRARFALAAAGDRRVQAWLEQDLAADAPESRLFAAAALATLGVAARGAPLLGDPDASVRMRAACTIVAAARFGR
jgi:HEAT repeat protein